MPPQSGDDSCVVSACQARKKPAHMPHHQASHSCPPTAWHSPNTQHAPNTTQLYTVYTHSQTHWRLAHAQQLNN